MIVPTNTLLKEFLPVSIDSVIVVASSPCLMPGGAFFICRHSVALPGAKALLACLPSDYPADAMRSLTGVVCLHLNTDNKSMKYIVAVMLKD